MGGGDVASSDRIGRGESRTQTCTPVGLERGELRNQTPIMVLSQGVDLVVFTPNGKVMVAQGVDLVVFTPNGKEMVAVEDASDFQRAEREEEANIEENEQMSWEESCLLRFNHFLGMSLEGYEEEVLDLMNKICGRRHEGKGKEEQGTTKLYREMKKLEWITKEKVRTLKLE